MRARASEAALDRPTIFHHCHHGEVPGLLIKHDDVVSSCIQSTKARIGELLKVIAHVPVQQGQA